MRLMDRHIVIYLSFSNEWGQTIPWMNLKHIMLNKRSKNEYILYDSIHILYTRKYTVTYRNRKQRSGYLRRDGRER